MNDKEKKEEMLIKRLVVFGIVTFLLLFVLFGLWFLGLFSL